VAGERVDEFTDKPVWIRGTGQAVHGFTVSNLPDDYSRWPAMRQAANDAYTMAGILPEDVDVSEVHDFFAIAALIGFEVADKLSPAEIGELRRVSDEFVRNAAAVTANDEVYDLEDTHSRDEPRVRRLKAPHLIDPAYFRASRNDKGVAILVIESDMRFIFNLCDLTAVLVQGQKIVEGDKETVQGDERVITAYLGAPLETETATEPGETSTETSE